MNSDKDSLALSLSTSLSSSSILGLHSGTATSQRINACTSGIDVLTLSGPASPLETMHGM